MNERDGVIFSIARDNAPVPGCTVSKAVQDGDNYICYFSLAKHTDISAEIFPYYKLLIMAEGSMTVYGSRIGEINMAIGDCLLTPADTPVGMKTAESAVYTEIAARKEDIMNEVIKAGEVFRLAEMVPYQEGKIVNMDVVHNDAMKFALMAFDAGTGLSEHAAPGDAIVFALDGEGVIGYEGKEYTIKAGENFRFAKGGMHSVKAVKQFKMGLLLTLA